MLDLHQLRVFITAAECQNFSQTARLLHMSQPSVSQNIQQLEASIGKPLFTRIGKRLIVSEAGNALLPMARQLVELSFHAEAIVSAEELDLIGELEIGCSTSPGKYVLPVILSDFMKKYPQVRATCHVTPRDYALEMLRAGKVHFAFSSSHDELDESIEFHRFINDPVQLIVPHTHRWAKVKEIKPAELLNEKFIMREDNSGTYKVVRNALVAVGMNPHDLKIILTLGNSEAIAIAVAQGLGVGFVSSKVYENMEHAKITVVNIQGVKMIQEIFICRHKLQHFGAVQKAFWNYILSYELANSTR
jgi:DNA-binding transcriptional LysR family regulator